MVKCGETETGTIYEQTVQATDPETGATLLLRRIEIRLFEKTRDGERVIGLLTNLPDTVSAMAIAEIYRKRWTIETQFQLLTVSLHCEVPGLGKPKAALFAFAMSLVASNALAVVRGSLRAAHGKEAEAEVSGYYLADEISAEYRTLAKYIRADMWVGWRRHMDAVQRRRPDAATRRHPGLTLGSAPRRAGARKPSTSWLSSLPSLTRRSRSSMIVSCQTAPTQSCRCTALAAGDREGSTGGGQGQGRTAGLPLSGRAYPSSRGSCERYALSRVAVVSRCSLLLLSPLLSAVGSLAWTTR